MLALCKLAHKHGLIDLARKFEWCSTDFIILRSPDGHLSSTPLRCNHKLCPICHAVHAKKIRARLSEVINRAHTMVTLTMASYRDKDLYENVRVLKKAFRSLVQRKKKEQWLPFEPGYFWRLEITAGKGFHPHLHCLSTHDWIPYDRLRKRWHSALDHAGGKGDLLWINEVGNNTLVEVSKYLSKDIDLIPAKRWWALNEGLKYQRTFGSGRALSLPKLEERGKRFVCFGSHVHHGFNDEYAKFIWCNQPGSTIRTDSPYFQRYTDIEEFKSHYLLDPEEEWPTF